MTLVEPLPVGDGCAQWSVWGTVARIVVADPAALPAAHALVEQVLAEVDAAASRFRPDSELRAACRVGGRPVTVSPLFADLLNAALSAARATDGDVDPTVGAALWRLGYDRDYAELAGRDPAPAGRGAELTGRLVVTPTVDWRAVELRGRVLRMPAGTLLDLGATAKAVAADRAAKLAAERLGVGTLVALGGDLATAGPAPTGWRIFVQDRPGDPHCTVVLPSGAALATSSTVSRRWRGDGDLLHHVLDPRTGRPARPVWRTASVAAFSCLRANTLSTAALIRGDRAPGWLRRLGLPARLVGADHTVLTLNDWPQAADDAPRARNDAPRAHVNAPRGQDDQDDRVRGRS